MGMCHYPQRAMRVIVNICVDIKINVRMYSVRRDVRRKDTEMTWKHGRSVKDKTVTCHHTDPEISVYSPLANNARWLFDLKMNRAKQNRRCVHVCLGLHRSFHQKNNTDIMRHKNAFYARECFYIKLA